MTEPRRKSRRRFMADLLFLGGGLSAAALLAKTQLSQDAQAKPTSQPSPVECVKQNVPPEVQGEMEIPQASQTHQRTPPNAAGGMRAPRTQECPPAIDGDYVQAPAPLQSPSPPVVMGESAPLELKD